MNGALKVTGVTDTQVQIVSQPLTCISLDKFIIILTSGVFSPLKIKVNEI